MEVLGVRGVHGGDGRPRDRWQHPQPHRPLQEVQQPAGGERKEKKIGRKKEARERFSRTGVEECGEGKKRGKGSNKMARKE